jgi:hypothetical protein
MYLEKLIKRIINQPVWHIILIWLICSIIFTLLSLQFKFWYIDDAVISFSYSRDLANGLGLVAQPGAIPVEGFSNPLWVFFLALIQWLGFNILSSAKYVALFFSIGALFLATLLGYQITKNFFLTAISTIWIAVQPPLVIWFSSGLENPLYVFLILLLIWISTLSPTKKRAVIAGLVAALIGLTRPEGSIFMLIFLLSNYRYWKPYLCSFFFFSSIYFFFRLAYFGSPFPNTFYMKVVNGNEIRQVIKYITYNFLASFSGFFGEKSYWIGTIFTFELIGIAGLAHKKIRLNFTLIFAVLISLVAFISLPSDWMGELRFASPFLFLFPIFIIMLCQSLIQTTFKNYSPIATKILSVFLASWLVFIFTTAYLPRLKIFKQIPTVPFTLVYDQAEKINQLAKMAGLVNYSVLQPDAGGSLWLNKYTLIDLGGLTDPVISRTLNTNPVEFSNYIFDERKPDFIEIHAIWSQRSAIQNDVRFLNNYVALCSKQDSSFHLADGAPIITGVFIQKDLIPSGSILMQMQKSASELCNSF